MNEQLRQLAVVTGASTGVGFELARLCARASHDLIIAADEPEIRESAAELSALGSLIIPVEVDLASVEGVGRLLREIESTGRPVDALLATAGRGPGKAFLDQDIDQAIKLAHANIDATLHLVHAVGRGMRARGEGRILIAGSIAEFSPGMSQAVYGGTKAFLDSFSAALADELKDTGVTITCLTPGADPAEVARLGFDAMMRGERIETAGEAPRTPATATASAASVAYRVERPPPAGRHPARRA